MRGRGIDTPRLQMFLPPFGSIPWVGFSFSTNMFQLFFPNIKSKWWTEKQTKLIASSGNRTRAARVAGEHSTTEPTMLDGCEVTLYCKISTRKAVVAEWLRRLTRNQFPSGSVGSNPTNCDMAFWIMSMSHCFPILDCVPLLLGTDSSIV